MFRIWKCLVGRGYLRVGRGMRVVFKYLWVVIWEWDVCFREIIGKCCEYLLNVYCVVGFIWVILFIFY